MKFAHVIQKVYFEPVMMTPALHASIRAIVEKHLDETNITVAEDDESDFFGNPIPKPYDVEGVRVIPVYGTIAQKIGKLEKTCGMVDVKDIRQWYMDAINDDNVKAIVFDVDSGGGFVTGVPELAEFIRSNSNIKPTATFTDGMMASAAYYIGAGTSMLFASPSSDVGSIGVYSYYITMEKMYENAGVKVELFTDGKYKAMGIEGLSLTEEQRDYLKQSVKETGDTFKGFIKNGREVSDDTMQGQTFSGTKGKEVGLIDENVETLDDVINYLKAIFQ